MDPRNKGLPKPIPMSKKGGRHAASKCIVVLGGRLGTFNELIRPLYTGYRPQKTEPELIPT